MDVYSFNDDPQSTTSQYLGHWNREGVIIPLDATMADSISNALDPKLRFEKGNHPEFDTPPGYYLPPLPPGLDKPVDAKDRLRKAEVYYPVRNRDFQRWRELKERGGDFRIFSSFEKIKLPTPIVFEFDEVCGEYKSRA
jgi:hypothetical protein